MKWIQSKENPIRRAHIVEPERALDLVSEDGRRLGYVEPRIASLGREWFAAQTPGVWNEFFPSKAKAKAALLKVVKKAAREKEIAALCVFADEIETALNSSPKTVVFEDDREKVRKSLRGVLESTLAAAVKLHKALSLLTVLALFTGCRGPELYEYRIEGVAVTSEVKLDVESAGSNIRLARELLGPRFNPNVPVYVRDAMSWNCHSTPEGKFCTYGQWTDTGVVLNHYGISYVHELIHDFEVRTLGYTREETAKHAGWDSASEGEWSNYALAAAYKFRMGDWTQALLGTDSSQVTTRHLEPLEGVNTRGEE